MAAKKKVTKKKTVKKSAKKTSKPDVDIKIRNVDKIIEADKCCSKGKGDCPNFWIFGSALAMVMSYERSASILWAIFHGILSWLYVLFRAMQTWSWF